MYANTYTKPTQCLLFPARWYRKAAYNGPTRLALLIPRSGRSNILNRSNLKPPKRNKHAMVYQSENHNLPCSNCHNLRLKFSATQIYTQIYLKPLPKHPSSIPLSSLSISRPPAFREDRVNGSRILCSQVRRRCSRALATRLATRRLVRRNWLKTDLNTNVYGILWD